MITKLLRVVSSVLPILLWLNPAWSAESTAKQKVLPVLGEQFMKNETEKPLPQE